MLLLPTQSKTERVKIRRKVWKQPEIGNRQKFRKGNPGRWKWGGVDASPSGSYSRIAVEGLISNSTRRINNLPGVDQDLLERWWFIDNGLIPPDEEAEYKIPTDEEMAEKAEDEIRPLETNAKTRTDEIRDTARHEINILHKEAEDLEADTNPRTRPRSLRQSDAKKRKAVMVEEEADRDVSNIANNVREQREEIKQRLRREQSQAIDKAAERVKELQAGLSNEIQAAANKYFEDKCEFELTSWELH